MKQNKVSYIRYFLNQHPSSRQISRILNISHPKPFTSKHVTSQIFISKASQITNIPHPNHSTSPTSHIPNIPNPKHPTSWTSRILNIPFPKHSTSKHLRFHIYHFQKLQILTILYSEEKDYGVTIIFISLEHHNSNFIVSFIISFNICEFLNIPSTRFGFNSNRQNLKSNTNYFIL